MHAFVAAGAGFLLAVLWFDLMHDVLVRDHDDGPISESALASIAGYYARVTTAARPMNKLVAAVMALTVVAAGVQLATESAALGTASLALALPPIVLAGRRTVPSAVRLGTRVDEIDEQSRLARRIHADHWFCFACILMLLVLQLVASI